MTSRAPGDPISEALATAEQQWRSMHIVERDRAALAAELRTELVGAAADGLTPRQLLGDDIPGFARNLAVSAGAERIPYDDRRLLRTAAAGAAPGLVLGGLAMFGGGVVPVSPGITWYLPPVILAGVLLTVRLRMADVPRISPTVAAMALLIPLAGVLVTPVIMGFAWLANYSTNLVVVAVEIATAAAAVGGATLLARRWALRSWKAQRLGAARRPATGTG